MPVGLSQQDGLPLHESPPEKLLVQLCKIDFRLQMREPVRFADFADLVAQCQGGSLQNEVGTKDFYDLDSGSSALVKGF